MMENAFLYKCLCVHKCTHVSHTCKNSLNFHLNACLFLIKLRKNGYKTAPEAHMPHICDTCQSLSRAIYIHKQAHIYCLKCRKLEFHTMCEVIFSFSLLDVIKNVTLATIPPQHSGIVLCCCAMSL